MDRISVPRLIVAGVLFAIVGVIVHTLGAFPTMGFYMDATYFPVWSKLMMPTAGPPPVTFYYYSVGFGIITGVLLALVYAIVQNAVPSIGVRRGVVYGFWSSSLPAFRDRSRSTF